MAEWPQYSTRVFPAYRFIPGRSPHPRHNPRGHSFGQPEPYLCPFEPRQWMTSEDYRYGIELYNRAYWWESHDVFEGLWHAFGRTTEAGNFFQALIQCAAANLKREVGHEPAVRKLVANGLTRLQRMPSHYMGLNTAIFAAAITEWLNQRRPVVRIRLELPGDEEEIRAP